MADSDGSGVKPTFSDAFPRLKVRSDVLKVARGPFYDQNGQKLEPEQQPAGRIMTVEGGAPVAGSKDGRQLGAVPMQIITEMSAGEAAWAMKYKCFLCKNFDQRSWNKLRLLWGNSSNKDTFAKLNKVRSALLTVQNPELARRSEGMDGDFDVEHALTQLGICQPLTEINGDPVIVSPISTCPAHVCTQANPTGLFVPKDKEAERTGSEAYDKIMRAAEGKAI